MTEICVCPLFGIKIDTGLTNRLRLRAGDFGVSIMINCPFDFSRPKSAALTAIACLGVGPALAQLTPTLSYLNPANSVDGEEGRLEDSASGEHASLPDPGVVYNGSLSDASSGDFL